MLSSASWPGSELGPKIGRPLTGALHMLQTIFWAKLGAVEPWLLQEKLAAEALST